MPSLSRRRETDGRADRLESEVRASEMQDPSFAAKRKFMCSKCHFMYEEKSRICPRCDTHTMGELKHHNVTDGEYKRSLDRARAHKGARLPGQGI
jgi:hypothetical protein